jgi:hypothetical protein
LYKQYPASAVKEFIGKAFGINASANSYEVQTNCPKCSHEAFFFNIRKQVGFCHRASCHYAPSLDDLIERAGFAPNEFGIPLPKSQREEAIITMPPGCVKVFDGSYVQCPTAFAYLEARGLSRLEIFRYDFQSDGIRVYIPIRYEDRLVSWLGRDLTGRLPKKYKLAPGSFISRYLFGWEECRQWDYLTLVENTFNSIRYRNLFNCSTNFGSYLGPEQLKLITNSRVKTVGLLWDQNTEASCERALKKLHSRGIKAAYAVIKGQPDDHPIEAIQKLAENVHEAARNGVKSVTL